MKPIVEGMGLDWAAQFTKLKGSRFGTSIADIAMQAPGDSQGNPPISRGSRK